MAKRHFTLEDLRGRLTLPEATIENPELYEIFTKTFWGYLVTFMANLPDSLTQMEKLNEALNLFFDTTNVTIDTYRAKADFKLPGELKDADKIYWQPGEVLREVHEGEFLIVRLNSNDPGFVEVQIVKDTFADLDDRRQFYVRPHEFYKFVRSKLAYVSSY